MQVGLARIIVFDLEKKISPTIYDNCVTLRYEMSSPQNISSNNRMEVSFENVWIEYILGVVKYSGMHQVFKESALSFELLLIFVRVVCRAPLRLQITI